MTDLSVFEERINQAIAQNATSLDLSLPNVSLHTEDLERLLPSIWKIENLENLSLKGNLLDVLPEGIGALKGLKDLDISMNNLNELPEWIGSLENLKNLTVSENKLTKLPSGINALGNLEQLYLEFNEIKELPVFEDTLSRLVTLNLNDNEIAEIPETIDKLSRLENLDLSYNALTDLPEQLCNLDSLISLDLRENNLNQEAITLLDEHFHDVALYQETVSNPNITVILDTLYPGEGATKLETINAVDGQIDIGVEEPQRIQTSEMISDFLSKIPIRGALANEVYHVAAKQLLDKVLNTETAAIDRESALVQISASLGNCNTPVMDLLSSTYVNNALEKETILNATDVTLVTALALKDRIKTELGKLDGAGEEIEIVQGLINAVFLEGSENDALNKLKIIGERNRIPSNSLNTEFAYNQVNDEHVKMVAKLCCKTDVAPTTGKVAPYEIDLSKLGAIKAQFLVKMGKIDQREQLINDYEKEIRNVLDKNLYVVEQTENLEAIGLMDIAVHQEELRGKLSQTGDTRLEVEFKEFIGEKRAAIEKLNTILTPPKVSGSLEGMTAPINSNQANAISRKRSRSPESRNRSRSPNSAPEKKITRRNNI
ncbi:leucine-rich repeat domain-containing protein [Aggregatimonas sangjinii]|uniref:Leucine-rich repeat domain-containing protein n=1 Tax=Aggregatimonas sangjinii TaxID=2583587 RepID=A0A5B7SQ27_9FLAO|nr:leucine-rich repeat domain-containing protein [Aggregatimonas sangjinii]QCX00637.1 leucine-rich repeat domain-containing protein [Aggregatimonas sangjinii]